MPHAYGGLTPQEVAELTQMFEELAALVKDKHARQILENLNKFVSKQSDGVVPFVNWNS